MAYLLLDNGGGHYRMLHEDSCYHVARVCPLKRGSEGPPYRIVHDEGEMTVNSLQEAIPAFAAYYESHPPRWRRESATRYEKETHFAWMRVEQVGPGRWSASRDDEPLMRDGKPVFFDTLQEAQRAADAHERQGYPNCNTVDDGLSWLVSCEWWLDPNIVANRARLMVLHG
jgi:hypothetical protein